MKKYCGKCHTWKAHSEFHRQAAKPDNCAAYCKLCSNSLRKERPVSRLSRLARGLMYKYGLTLREYEAMLEAQGAACAICAVSWCPTGRVFAVDHDHNTGAIRGLLCMACNTAIGALQDSPARMASAIRYLQKAQRCSQ